MKADEAGVGKTNPFDEGQGWLKPNCFEIIVSCGPVLPTSLADLLDTGEEMAKKRNWRMS